MSRSETDYRQSLISLLNDKYLPKAYIAIHSQYLTFARGSEKAKKLGSTTREFDIPILRKRYKGLDTVNTSKVEYNIEAKKHGSNTMGEKQAEDAFIAFNDLKISYGINFGSKVYRRRKGSLEEYIDLDGSSLTEHIENTAQLIGNDIKNQLKYLKRKIIISEKEALAKLKDCVEVMQQEFHTLPDETIKTLEDVTGLLWARKIDYKAYLDKEASVRLQYDVKRAAAYILVNQILFYYILQQNSTFNLPRLEELDISNPTTFGSEYFDVLEKVTGDYQSVYGTNVLKLLQRSKNVVNAINRVISTIVSTKLETLSSDILGKIFHSMIPLQIRRKIAGYYTGNGPAYLLARLAIKKHNTKVCDLACGSGTLLTEAYHVMEKIFPKKVSLAEKHNFLLKNLYGNDVVLFSAHLATVNLAIQNLKYLTNEVNITVSDGLTLIPRTKVMGLEKFLDSWKEKIQREALGLDEEIRMIEYPMMDCLIMNPPFSRHEVMEPKTKKFIKELMKSYKLGEFVDERFGLHCYFIIHGDQFLEKGGTLALVLPTSTFTTQYTLKILQFLKTRRYSIDYVMEINTLRSAFSEDCNFKEYMVVLRKGNLKKTNKSVLISFNEEFDSFTAESHYDNILNRNSTPNLIIKEILTEKLYSSSIWTELFVTDKKEKFGFVNSPKIDYYFFKSELMKEFEKTTGKSAIYNAKLTEKYTSWLEKNKKTDDYETPFKGESLFKMVSGFHGTYSEYLILPNGVWDIIEESSEIMRIIRKQKLDENSLNSCTIPSKYCIKAIRKSEFVNQIQTTTDHYVLDLPNDYIETYEDLSDFVNVYLRWANNDLTIRWDEARKRGHRRVKPVMNYHKDQLEEPWWAHAHVNKCSRLKGHLFSPTKYRPTKKRTLFPFLEEEVTVNHGMWIINTINDKFYASWLNSTLFLYSLFKKQQIIAKSFYKYAIKDFYGVKLPIYNLFSNEEVEEAILVWQSLSAIGDDLPFIPEQLEMKLEERQTLDKFWLKALGVKNNRKTLLDNLYAWLLDYLSKR